MKAIEQSTDRLGNRKLPTKSPLHKQKNAIRSRRRSLISLVDQSVVRLVSSA
ncbi:hypothetical protein [Nostoc sp.]|uniref:hypothetical protein n=1 Tax=Nostoc sp. TaxID=1180 RepID=UPI002FF13F5A